MRSKLVALGLSALAFAAFAQPALGAPRLSVADTKVVEGQSGRDQAAKFVLTLDRKARRTVEVPYETRSRQAGRDDYVPAFGVATIKRKAMRTTIEVPVRGDMKDDSDERFNVVLAPPEGARLGDGRASALILDDDCPPPPQSCAASIYAINAGAFPNGTEVVIENPQVTAEASANQRAWIGIMEGDPGFVDARHSGLELDTSQSPTPDLDVGTRGNLVGTVGEPFVLGNVLSQTVGETPVPHEVAIDDLGGPRTPASRYDNVLVSATGAYLVGGDGTDTWTITWAMHASPIYTGAFSMPDYPYLTHFESIVGIFKDVGRGHILVRAAEDITPKS